MYFICNSIKLKALLLLLYIIIIMSMFLCMCIISVIHFYDIVYNTLIV